MTMRASICLLTSPGLTAAPLAVPLGALRIAAANASLHMPPLLVVSFKVEGQTGACRQVKKSWEQYSTVLDGRVARMGWQD